ncbi:MAG: hypothetical protein LBR73_03090 [Oscillospiraceae bacterium]|nr:hypothetical protein [Oscillospiraceae bacterium]
MSATIKLRTKEDTHGTAVALLLAAALLFLAWYLFFCVRSELSIPYGAAFPEAQAFVYGGFIPADYEGSRGGFSTEKPGVYSLKVRVLGIVHSVRLHIVDATPPQAEAAEAIAFLGDTQEPQLFVTNVLDVSEVRYAYETEPDWNKSGEQAVTVLLTDTADNVTRLTAKLTLLRKNNLRFELGQAPKNLELKDFFPDPIPEGIEITIEDKQLNLSEPLSDTVAVTINAKTYLLPVVVADTTPPTAKSVEAKLFQNGKANPTDLVTDINDLTEVQVAFAKEPDLSRIGKQTLEVLLKDTAGNIATIPVPVEVVKDEEPPVISGVRTLYVMVGGTVSYRADVTVADNSGADITLGLDSSKVKLNAEGTYEVIYSAADPSGNRTEKTAEVVVGVASPEQVDRMVDNLFKQLFKDGMSLEDKARVIHRWVRDSVKYASSGEKEGLVQGCYNAFAKRQGDCYTYYAAVKYMYDRLGVENVPVQRQEGAHNSTHFWLFVNLGYGWRYVDATPVSKLALPNLGFMMTQAQVDEWAQATNRAYYYQFDPASTGGIVSE